MSTTYSQAALGYGSTFSTGVTTAGNTTYTPVSEISSIKFGGFTIAEVDVTHLQSPDAVMESIPGILKPGTIELSGNFIGDAAQLNLTSLGQNRTVFAWQITAPMAGTKVYTLTGQGFVSKLEKGPFETTKKADFSVTIQVTGSFTEAVA